MDTGRVKENVERFKNTNCKSEIKFVKVVGSRVTTIMRSYSDLLTSFVSFSSMYLSNT